MSEFTMNAKKKPLTTATNPPIGAIIDSYRREIMGGLLLLLTVLTLVSLLSLVHHVALVWWAETVSKVFGWGAIPATLLAGVFGVMLTFGRFKEEYRTIPFDIIIGLELLLIVSLAMTHMATVLITNTEAYHLVRLGHGGGFVGWGVSSFLMGLLGPAWAILVMLMLGWLAVVLVFRLTLRDIWHWTNLVSQWTKQQLERQKLAKTTGVIVMPTVSVRDYTSPVDFNKPTIITPAPSPTSERKAAEAPPSFLSKIAQVPLPFIPPPAKPQERLDVPATKKALSSMPKRHHALPPLTLMNPVKDEHRNYNPYLEEQAKIIEETLLSFDVPAKVVEKQAGPTISQFGLTLGTIDRRTADGPKPQRVRVSKVLALINDLALALSASPIRIEAPIPGRPLVGIEVPNVDKSFVSLRGVLESKNFQNIQAPLQVALGLGVSGEVAVTSLIKMPHLLIAGATGSGKSVCLNTIIATLLFTHAPEELRLLMIDPKMVELTSYNGIPHLIAPVVTDFDQVVGALSWVTREMERRYKLFAKIGARSINTYNQKVEDPNEQLPYLVVVIDELADLMMMAPDEVEHHICRIAQMARATGIHLVVATQRPSTDVITGLIKANFPARIAFAVTSQIDSRVILDSQGAEKLLGQGDMLFMSPDSSKLLRLQGCFIADKEIQNLVDYWKKTKITPTTASNATEMITAGELPWTDILAEAEKDDLLEQAVKIVTESGRASASFLQRRLGVGYPRASRLLDQLENDGVIGPAEGSKGREVLWRENKDEADYAEFEEDVIGSDDDDDV